MTSTKNSKPKAAKAASDDLGAQLRTSEGISDVAAKVAVMAENGVKNFSRFGIQSSHVRILKRIASKATIPEVMLKFAAKPEAALAISMVPVKQQEKLVSHPYVNLVRRAGETYTYSLESIYDLTAHEIQQLFSGGSTRSVQEQEDVLSNPDVDGTVKGDTRTINTHLSHADYAAIEKARHEGGFTTKCALMRAVLRGEAPPPLKRK